MELALPQNFQEDDAPKVVEQARPMLDLPNDAQVHVETVSRNARGTRIDFSYTHSVQLDDEQLGQAMGARVDVNSHGDLMFNPNGHLTTYNVEPADPRQLRAISDHVSKMVANGEVYIATPDEKIDPDQLRRQRKAWYLQQDENGNKHLKRAWVS